MKICNLKFVDCIELFVIAHGSIENLGSERQHTVGILRAPAWRMTPQELRDRTQPLGVSTIRFCRELRRNPEARELADQLRSSATSVGANYRVACHARSKREFISKLCIALEEADETVGWLELLLKSGTVTGVAIEGLLKEAREIARIILAASRRTAERGKTAPPESSQ